MKDSLQIDIQEEEGYLSVNVSGSLSLKNLKELVDRVLAESKKRSHDLFLVDMLRTGPPENEMDRFDIGNYVASELRGVKIAVVYPQKYTNKFFENTAVNRGAHLLVFSEKERAVEWLFGKF